MKKFIYLLFLAIVTLTSAWIGVSNPSALTVYRQLKNPIKLYSNQAYQDLKFPLILDFKQANDSIVVYVYTLSDQDIINVLREKAEEGKEVIVVTDAKANNQKLAKLLGPKVKLIKRTKCGLMHQKIFIVDDKKIWIGSANLTKESLKVHGNMMAQFRANDLGKKLSDEARAMTPSSERTPWETKDWATGEKDFEFWMLPDPNALNRLLRAIDNSTETLKIAMFTWTHPVIRKSVIEAKKRGVDVQVVIDQGSGKGASAETVWLLKRAGVPVKLSGGVGLLHYKLAWIDDDILIQGSANWTKAAFTQNEESFMILEELKKSEKDVLSTMWKTIWTQGKAP